jgi:adenylate cyclase class IV
MHTYEVEIKVLLGNEIHKNDFMEKVHVRFPDMQHEYSESQKNHYFEGGDLRELERVLFSFLGEDALMRLRDIQVRAKSFSVRTRGTIENTIIVVKATVNDESSSNGTARIEWEIDLAPMTLEELDAYVLSAGFTYQAKWSRARDSYVLDGRTILCLDKNA